MFLLFSVTLGAPESYLLYRARYALKMRFRQTLRSHPTRRTVLFSLVPLAALAACAREEQPEQSPQNTAESAVPETSAAAPEFPQLQKLLMDRAGAHRSALVTHTDGNIVYGEGENEPRAAASAMKVLTYLALAHSIDLGTRFKTSVARNGNELTLIAGGDTMLGAGDSKKDAVNGYAGLGTLAGACIESLRSAKPEKGKFPVFLDTSIYTGPELNPGWEKPDIDSGQITGISPIALDSHTIAGKSGPYGTPARPTDAASAAAQAFVDALNKAGEPHGYSFERKDKRTKPSDATDIASVESATALQQAQHMMLESDNTLAEALTRNAVIAAGRQGSAEEAQKLVREKIEAAGVTTEHLKQADVCGLSLENRVTARMLVQALAKLLEHPRHEELLQGLPVAGKTGTLKERFTEPDAADARGHVRAKTGTLFTAVALAGYTTRPDGTRLIFALILNDTDSIGGLPQAKKVADAAAAVISDRAPKPSPSPSDSSHSAGEHSPSESAKPAESPKATDTSTSNAPVTLAPAGEPAPTEGK